MGISIDKILNVSFDDYIDSADVRDKSKSSYRLVGVHYKGDNIKKFAKKVPEGTEVVVNYNFHSSNGTGVHTYNQWGTALIPKE